MFMERQEQMRLEKKRREYLEMQRARERDQPQNLSPEQRDSVFVSMELVDLDNAGKKREARRKKNHSNFTQSTISSRSVATVSSKNVMELPACMVCKTGERTHIATPCMHFAYCKECALRRAKQGKGCYVCLREGVTYSAVSVSV
jgi:Zinc finger, C3HC4 type (RING finger)